MAVTDDGEVPETDLTEQDGLCEKKAVVAMVTIEKKASEARAWNYWRTSPNYTCFRTTDEKWLMQVGRNDPVVSIHAVESGYEATAVVDGEDGIVAAMVNVVKNPKEALIDLWRRRDEDWVITRKFDYDELSFEDYVASEVRQTAWGTNETSTLNEGDSLWR